MRLVNLFLVALALAPPVADAAQGRVVRHPVEDWAGVIDAATETKLTGYLMELRAKTTVEIAVVTVQSLGGKPVFEYSHELAEASQLGTKQEDNGCLLLVAIEDRKYFTQVGYGLEGILPDGLVGRLQRKHLVPQFKAGRYSEGIEQCLLAYAQTVASAKGVQLEGVPRPAAGRAGGRRNNFQGLFIVFVMVIIFLSMISAIGRTRPRGSLWYLLLLGWMGTGGYSRRGGGGGWTGSGFGGGFSSGGGGSFGGFGGGGGSFGGGGAGGGW